LATSAASAAASAEYKTHVKSFWYK
jgi:hypothetical protein